VPTEHRRLPLAIVHDYLTQRGGAERVVELFCELFPGAPVRTSLYDPDATFPSFRGVDVHTGALDRIGVLRHHHRLALPLLAPWFASQRVDADVVLASSSGWAHEVRTTGRLVVYCHAPARWLYQPDRYLRTTGGSAAAKRVAGAALSVLGPPLRRVDRVAARRASTYLANSTATAALVRELYGRDAEVLCPPPALDPDGEQRPVDGVEPGFVLCVARLLAYKHVDVVVRAAARLDRPLVVVGDGPERRALEAEATAGTRFLGVVDDATLRWCYARAAVLVSVGYEDFGLTPLEAAAFGTPTVARRFGGALDTVIDGGTGRLLADEDVDPARLREAIRTLVDAPPPRAAVVAHAQRFGRERFAERLRAVVSATST
jgi:glycosyltransferase involved in cell wall biosynthesis